MTGEPVIEIRLPRVQQFEQASIRLHESLEIQSDFFAHIVRQVRIPLLHDVVVGQDEAIDLLLMCALTESHALLVGVPGLAKTLMVKALSAALLAR